MEITSTSQTAGAAGLSAATKTDDTAVISSDFETFLVMLTAQIKNQDPLNPMDSSDYAVQLATFSGVEQQVLTNELLRNIDNVSAEPDLMSLANWVGLETEVEGSAYYSGDPMELSVAVPVGADWAKMIVRDTAGREVQTVDLEPGATQAVWDGSKAGGGSATAGAYVAELHVYSGGESMPTITELSSYMKIVEVRQGAQGMEVILANGKIMAADAISKLRSPS